MSYPKISVVIPVYNSERFILDALGSVKAQQYPNLEIIVVNDGSTDGSIEKIQNSDFEVTIIHQENGGPASARNKGVENASGELIAFLDADDLYPANKFEIQLDYLQSHPDIELVAGRIQYVYLDGALKPDFDFGNDEQTLLHVHLGSMLTKKQVFEKLGQAFDASLRFSEDIDWWMRIRENNINYVVMPDITLHYRLHDSNMTREVNGISSDLMRALQMSLKRRRASGDMHLDLMSARDLKDSGSQAESNDTKQQESQD